MKFLTAFKSVFEFHSNVCRPQVTRLLTEEEEVEEGAHGEEEDAMELEGGAGEAAVKLEEAGRQLLGGGEALVQLVRSYVRACLFDRGGQV